MANTRSVARNQSHDDDASSSSSSSSSSSTTKRFETFDNMGVTYWSNLTHDVVFLIMMQLGVVDFVAFSEVCRSWRSLALSNWNIFMASKPPMSVFSRASNEDSYWYLEDFERRRFKTFIPHSAGRICFGLTSGYLILGGRETQDFWLVNPITRHELHFPGFPIYVHALEQLSIKDILFFSPSTSGWVFVVLHRNISFSIAGKRGWNHVSSTIPILDLHALKGKIYILHTDFSVCELRLDPNSNHKWPLLETKNFPKSDLSYPQLISSGENIYLMSLFSQPYKVFELDFGEMKWVSPKKTIEEYAFFLSEKKSSAAIKPESWVGPQTHYKSYDYFLHTNKIRQRMFYYQKWMWYFPCDCLNVNILDQ
ncbi:unnamed protein product [Lactuca virosa]|uniref:F-box domain-containing protein n=1 Tax=Lactuca virosa TaxID=75947 RepID=A0AAU9PIB5_9ASTR|nr:unnamed protein product [Lactuca virosa]